MVVSPVVTSRSLAVPVPTPAPGVMVFSEQFEQVVSEIRAGVDALAASEGFARLSVPPVISRQAIERAGYVAGFPHLLGTVHSYRGDDQTWRQLRRQAKPGGEWHGRQRITDVVLTPAACYHAFVHMAGSAVHTAGSAAEDAGRFAVESYCYRHEATDEPGRLRSFRMKELVYVGSPDGCVAWRDRWLERAGGWLRDLGLDVAVEVATDPFFGTDARLLRRSQAKQSLKLELTAPVADGIRQAVASANYHKEHFGEAFDIRDRSSQPAHSACTAFGMERLAMALLHQRSA